jgi:hypothetical protein
VSIEQANRDISAIARRIHASRPPLKPLPTFSTCPPPRATGWPSGIGCCGPAPW